MRIKLERKWQVALPDYLVEALGLAQADDLECELVKDEIHLRPVEIKKGLCRIVLQDWTKYPTAVCTFPASAG